MDSCPRSNSVDVEDETCSSSSEEYDSQDQDLLSDSDVLDWIPEEDDGSVKTGFLHSPVRKQRPGTWILIRNYVLSLWQELEAKMLSSMSYTPPEVFAFSLKSKLETLRSSANTQQTSAIAQSMPSSNRLRFLLENHSHDMTMLGTTFPPSRCVPVKLSNQQRFRSQTDLNAQVEDLKELVKAFGDAETDQDDQMTLEENTEKNTDDDDMKDSDLFFDFDISSPPSGVHDDEDDDEDDHIINEIRRSSESSGSETHPSTAFGSTSSGLYSDADVKSADIEADQGFCIEPEDWLCSNYNDILAKNKDAEQKDLDEESTPVKAPASPANSTMTHDVSSDETLDGNDETTKICIGDKEKLIATSKLTSLISLLEKDKNSIKSKPILSSRSSTIGKVSSPEKQPSSPTKISIVEKPIFGTSPANFSFLSSGLDSQADDAQAPEPVANGLERCHSTSIINDIKKMSKSSASSNSSSVVGSLTSELGDKQDTHSSSSSSDKEKNNEAEKAKYRRCSSLKSGKTPPGTPGRRKIVRFADVFGLDLADVKTFLDEIPKVPKSAFRDLKDAELSDLESNSDGSERSFPVQPPLGPPPVSPMPKSSLATPTFSPLFSQPSGTPDFFNRLRDQKVKLESAYMCDISTVKGVVRVVNLDFHKSVFAKYSLDEWETSADVQAAYMPGSCDGFSDKFVFTIDLSCIKGQVGKKVHFCICFTCSSNQYWDNNNGRNYIFQCFGAPNVQRSSAPIPTSMTSKPYQQQVKPLPSHYGMSQSPSAINDDPWQRYL